MSLLQGKPTKLAVVQTKIIQDDKDYNLQHAIDLIKEASSKDAKIICLPQTFATGTNFPSINRYAEEDDSSTIINTLKELASNYSIYIIFGMLEKSGKDYYDSAYIMNSKGEIIGKYRRKSLLSEEAEYFTQGTSGEVIDTEFGKIGLLIGYDIRFPISCLNYFKEKVTMIVCMSNMFIEYGYPIESICRTRAADNVCYFVYVSCVGMHKFVNTNYMGNSLIIDGSIEDLSTQNESDILAKAEQKETVIYGDLYFKKMQRYQKKPSTRYYADYDKFWT